MLQIEDYVKYRHGDVILKPAQGAKPKGAFARTLLLHKGEQHHHRLAGGSFRVGLVSGVKVLQVQKQTILTHEEHGPIKVKPGVYAVEIQSEYDHFLEESRNVID